MIARHRHGRADTLNRSSKRQHGKRVRRCNEASRPHVHKRCFAPESNLWRGIGCGRPALNADSAGAAGAGGLLCFNRSELGESSNRISNSTIRGLHCTSRWGYGIIQRDDPQVASSARDIDRCKSRHSDIARRANAKAGRRVGAAHRTRGGKLGSKCSLGTAPWRHCEAIKTQQLSHKVSMTGSAGQPAPRGR